MRSIKVLPESVRNSLRSGIILSDLTRVVEELVFNSLDAGATKVIVAVGVGTNYIKVTDNGCGITRDGLVLLGERYATSKFEQLAGLNTVPESFGFRGEALSSISDVSLLQVVTKAHGMPNGYCKVIKCSKCLYLGIDDDRQDVGTTVVVRDLFYNQPVRRRHLQSSPKKILHSVKECILRIALVHLGTCFKVIDIESGDELLSLYPSSSPLPLLVSSFGTEVSSTLHKLDASDGQLKISGCISGPCETFSVKAFQYFYINSRYISRCPIHKLLNQLASDHNSSDPLKADIRSECGKRNRWQQACLTYILNLSCPRAYYDLSFEPTKTCAEFKDWDPVYTFIKKAVASFWNLDAHMSKEDIWKEADTLSTIDDPLSDCGLVKKRRMAQSQKTCIALSSPQLEIPIEAPKHMPSSLSPRIALQSEDCGTEMEFDNLLKFSPMSLPECKAPIPQTNSSCISHQDAYLDTKCSSKHMDHLSDAKRTNPNDRLAVKKTLAVTFRLDDEKENVNDDDLMKPFLRSCSSHIDLSPVTESTICGEQLGFQADGFRKWAHLDDRFDKGESESEPWLLENNATVWSPPRIISTDSSFLPKGSFDSVLTDTDLFTDNISPVAPNRSSKLDWSPFMFVCTDDDERDFKLRRDKWFDLFANEEESDIFDSDNMMRYSSSEMSFKKHVWDSQNEHQTCIPVVASSEITQSGFQDKKPKRSHSAPPSYKGKRNFVARNSQLSVESTKSQYQTLHNANLQVSQHVQKSPGVDHLVLEEGPTHDLHFKARHNKKKSIDKAEISDYEGEAAHCLDVYNTDSDFTSRENEGALDCGGKWRDSSVEKKHDNAICEDNILDISCGILHLSGDSLKPKSISKKCMDDAKVLPQLDKKFIPIVGDGILAIIDQHAADERIRLEDLREKVLSGKMKTVCYLDAEQELVLPEIGYQLLKNYSEQIRKWGWICNFHAQSSVSFKKNLNFLHNQPSVATLIAVPCILGVNLTDADLLEFLKQLADTDGSSIMPPAVVHILNTKACRGAIMFGDALLPSECSLLVEELKQTSLCFQCAHGRPTTVGLVDLAVLHKQIGKLGNRNHGSCGPWHGLTRHRPSLERATQRLGQ